MSTTFADGRIDESSGLAYSQQNDGVIWTINDEPTTPNVFGVSTSTGATVSTITWDGDPGLVDPEAISIDVLRRMWHADLGDNDPSSRDYVRFLMAPEPKALGNHTLKFSKYLAKYEDGHRNAECFLTHNKTFGQYVITKEATSHLYKLPPLKGGGVFNTMARMDPTFGAYVSDGAISPDGKWLAILRRDQLLKAYMYDIEDDWSFADDITLADHGQTKIEGVTFDLTDGKSIWVSSEGSHAPLFETALPSGFWPGSSPAPAPVPCF